MFVFVICTSGHTERAKMYASIEVKMRVLQTLDFSGLLPEKADIPRQVQRSSVGYVSAATT